MKMRRLAGVVAAAALLVGSMGTAAVAAPPSNDDVGSATVIAGFPFSSSLDTSEATDDPTDPLPTCDGTLGATVWYSYTAMSDEAVQFNTFGSDYDTVIAVYAGEAIESNEVACNDDAGGGVQSRVNVALTSSTTYLIMVGSFGEGPGGDLQFTMDVQAPPIDITVSIDPRGSVVPKTGEATIHGTVTCSSPTTVALDSYLRQRAGRVYIYGYGYSEVECDGSATFEVTTIDTSGLFAGGKVDAQVFAFSYDDDDAIAFAEQAVRLSGVKTSKK